MCQLFFCVPLNEYNNNVVNDIVDLSDKPKYCEPDEEHSILWNRTMAGKEISRPCPGNRYGGQILQIAYTCIQNILRHSQQIFLTGVYHTFVMMGPF